MSQLSEHYRLMAAKARSAADAAVLPNVKQLHSRSADRLDQILQGMEKVAEAKSRNDGFKDATLRAAETGC